MLKRKASRSELIEVAKGERKADKFIKGGTVVNVYSGEMLKQSIAIYKDCIAYVGESEISVGADTLIIQAEGKTITPGFIESHAHPWVIYNPVSFALKALATGTTTTVNDNLYFYTNLGASNFERMLDRLKDLPGNHFWLLRLAAQSRFQEEKECFDPEIIRKLLELDEVAGTAEITRWPMIYEGDPFILDMIEYAKKLGKISDGHTAGCSYEKLNAIAAAGISACHEAIKPDEVLNRLRLGLWTVLRNSSLRSDLERLITVFTEQKIRTNRVIMTTDGPNPSFIEREGLVNGMVRMAVASGLDPIQAIQMVTINPAQYLHLEEDIGGIAPGRIADILIFPDIVQFQPEIVMAGGDVVFEKEKLIVTPPVLDWGSLTEPHFSLNPALLSDPILYRPALQEPSRLPVIHFISTVITEQKEIEVSIRDGFADLSNHLGILYAALIDRHGQWVTYGLIEELAPSLEGLATTFNATTHLLVIGRDPDAMMMAAKKVYEMGGGIAVVHNKKIEWAVPLQIAGMMLSDSDFEQAVEYDKRLAEIMQRSGYRYNDALYSLLFLTCDGLPNIKMLSLGIYDVKKNEIIQPPYFLH